LAIEGVKKNYFQAQPFSNGFFDIVSYLQVVDAGN